MTSSGWVYQYIVRNRFINARYLEPRIRRHLVPNAELVLDFGCGTGPMSYMFDCGAYLGVDIDPVRIRLARKFSDRYNFSCIGHDGRIGIDDNTVEATVIVGVLHHMSDSECRSALKEIRRVMKPAGKLIIMEPTLKKGGWLRNSIMITFDKGKYLRSASGYLELAYEISHSEINEIFGTPNLYRTAFITGELR